MCRASFKLSALLAILGSGVAVSAQPRPASVPLPIRPGYYNDQTETCRQSMVSKNGLMVRAGSFAFVDMETRIDRVTRMADGGYRIRESAGSNAGEGVNRQTSVVRILGPTRFSRTVEGNETMTYQFCSPREPADFAL